MNQLIRFRKSGADFMFCLLFLSALLGMAGCGNPAVEGPAKGCAPVKAGMPDSPSGSSGKATVFLPDPISSSGDMTLTPSTENLDQFKSSVNLAHLTGKGVLDGKYVSVVNGLRCKQGFGAFDIHQNFSYSHSDWRFAEAMSYSLGDLYQSGLEATGYLLSQAPIKVVAHCMEQDNAYFVRSQNQQGQQTEMVCLGDSQTSPGASYADDGMVIVHELEHATTSNNYSLTEDLGQLFYDEAGSLNEAISDFMAMLFAEALLPAQALPQTLLDPRIFSPWALGTYDPRGSRIRGAHPCPVYDSRYQDCSGFPGFSVPTPAHPNESTISYIYPDGLGWPYSENTSETFPISQVFKSFSNQDEIHHAGILMEGALWDIYSSIQAHHSSDAVNVRQAVTQLVLESLRHLAQPNLTTHRSPVTFVEFATNLVNYSPQILSRISGFTEADQTGVATVLKKRGLYQAPRITNPEWLQVGPGTNWLNPVNPVESGILVQDNPNVLISWLNRMGADSSIVKQDLTTALNAQLDPGEVAAIWFDLQNVADETAGGVLLTVTSQDSDLEILNQEFNIGYLSQSDLNQTQVIYPKVNGKKIVDALSPPNAIDPLPIGNTYFKTHPFFNKSFRSAVWVRVGANTVHEKTVNLNVHATPTNGVESDRMFSIKIH